LRFNRYDKHNFDAKTGLPLLSLSVFCLECGAIDRRAARLVVLNPEQGRPMGVAGEAGLFSISIFFVFFVRQ